MNRLLTLATLLLSSTLASTLAFASEPPQKPEESAPTPAQASAARVVQTKLIQPLAAKESEHSRFSRVRMPAQARRVRVLDAEPKKDSKGTAFLTFAVDARHGFALLEDPENFEKSWRKDAMTGCVYVESGEVFVQRGESFLPAAMLMGKKTPAPAEHVCKSAEVQLAQK